MTGLISPSLQAQLGARVVVEQPALALVRPRIPVVSGPRLIEMAGLERGLALLAAPNAKPVVARKTKAIAAIELLAYGDDTQLQPHYGNPRALSHDSETDDNPQGVWTFKKLQHAG
jgi:hypothetical protein